LWCVDMNIWWYGAAADFCVYIVLAVAGGY
jgi:hypothetical protein